MPPTSTTPGKTPPTNMTRETTATMTADNGVNVMALMDAREVFETVPDAAQFTWRSQCRWLTGTHSRSTVSGFFGTGTEHKRRQGFTLEADHPEPFGAKDNAPTPAEIALAALAACLTAGVAAVAQHRGIQMHSVTANVEGDMDVQGILGMDADVRNGFSAIRVTFDISADATPDEIRAVVAQSQKRSAVFDCMTNPTIVTVAVN